MGGQWQIVSLQFSPFSVRAFRVRNAGILITLLYKINLEHMPEVEFYLEDLMDCDSDILNLNLSNCVFDFVRTPTL